MFQLAPHPEWHPVFETLGYAAAFAVYKRERQRSGDVINDAQRWTLIAAATIGALIGSRVLGLWSASPQTRLHFWQLVMPTGGKTIVGGLLGGWFAVEFAKKLNSIQTRTGDLFAIPLCIGIAIGRIGCLLAGLADYTYGNPTSLAWVVDFGDGVARHPTQAYEIAFLAFLALALYLLQQHSHRNGFVFRVFLVAYLLWRFCVDFLKPEPLLYHLNVIQWACAVGLTLLVFDAGRLLVSDV